MYTIEKVFKVTKPRGFEFLVTDNSVTKKIAVGDFVINRNDTRRKGVVIYPVGEVSHSSHLIYFRDPDFREYLDCYIDGFGKDLEEGDPDGGYSIDYHAMFLRDAVITPRSSEDFKDKEYYEAFI